MWPPLEIKILPKYKADKISIQLTGVIRLSLHKTRPHADCERMQCGDETDTDSNAYLVIEIQFVKVSQDGQISHIVSVPLRHTLDILTAPKPKSRKILTCNSSFADSSLFSNRPRCARTGTYIYKVCIMYCVRVPDLGSETTIVYWRITTLLHFRLAFNSMRICRYCLSATRSLVSVLYLLHLAIYATYLKH